MAPTPSPTMPPTPSPQGFVFHVASVELALQPRAARSAAPHPAGSFTNRPLPESAT